MEFRWNDWNVEHIAEHGISPADAETAVRTARRPFPRYEGHGKYRVWGRDAGGAYLQVLFVYDPPGVIFVIHARPLDEREKRLFRRKLR
jgi:uncharacterized DUF497 family protein